VATSNDFPLPSPAEVNYNYHFSYGHDVLPISGRNLLCGLFAMENSLKHRADLPDWNHIDFINVVTQDENYKASCKEFSLGNTQNFSVRPAEPDLAAQGKEGGCEVAPGLHRQRPAIPLDDR
jgi:hypothetical protein